MFLLVKCLYFLYLRNRIELQPKNSRLSLRRPPQLTDCSTASILQQSKLVHNNVGSLLSNDERSL